MMNTLIAKSVYLPFLKKLNSNCYYDKNCSTRISMSSNKKNHVMLRTITNKALPIAVSGTYNHSDLEDGLLDYFALLISPEQKIEMTLSGIRVLCERFRGKTVVVKYGGAAMNSEELQASVIDDVVLLSSVGIHVVLVHGGGPHINLLLRRLGIEPVFTNGVRVTDASTLEAVSMVLMGKVNPRLVTLINKSSVATAVGLSGIDGRLLTVRPSTQHGYVGDIVSVDPAILNTHIVKNHIPVIAPLGADSNGQLYNINADTVAGEVAASLGAEKLILLTDVAGILENSDDPTSLMKEIDIKGVEKMKEDSKISGGMIPKVNCCVRSLTQGVKTSSIIDGRMKHSLLREIFTDKGAGTRIVG